MASAREVITSIKHPAIERVRRSLGQVGGGPPSVFVIEDPKMIAQAVQAQAPLETVLFLHPLQGADAWQLYAKIRETGIDTRLVTRGVFFRVLDLGYETATRVLGIVRAQPLPLSMLPTLVEPTACFLVGEQIQDPRNVGVLIRTAEAFSVRAAIFSADSADPYMRASVRSTTGSILRLPLLRPDSLCAALELLREHGVRLIGSSAHAALPCWDADLSAPCAILVGNETTGLSEAARASCDLLISIPMLGRASSLNVTVAAGVLLYEVQRQSTGDHRGRPASEAFEEKHSGANGGPHH